ATAAALSACTRKNALAQFQFRVTDGQAKPLGGLAYLGGPRPDPPIEEVRKAIFALLDTNKDGKLSKEELSAAPDVLLRLDDDEDEIITAAELVPYARPADPFGGIGAMARPGRSGSVTDDKTLVLIPAPGEVPPALVRRIQQRYGPRSDKPEEKKLSRKGLGLDGGTFRGLDANKDGVLDSAELPAFVKRAPDIELVIRVGKKGTTEATVEVVTDSGPSPLADKVKRNNDVAL